MAGLEVILKLVLTAGDWPDNQRDAVGQRHLNCDAEEQQTSREGVVLRGQGDIYRRERKGRDRLAAHEEPAENRLKDKTQALRAVRPVF